MKLSEPFPHRIKRKPTPSQAGNELESFENLMGMVGA